MIYIKDDKMRVSDILFYVWFIIVMVLDKFIQSYYSIALLIITVIFLYAIHKFNMKEKAETVKEPKKQKS